MKQSQRLPYLDIYRCIFVLFAAFSHMYGHLGTWESMSENTMLIFRLFTRGATPGLLILFGVMLELVYVEYVKRKSLNYACQKLLYRSMLCYLAFISIALFGFLGGNTSIRTLVGAVTLLGTSLYANIFKLYFFMLLVAIPILAVRTRFGTLVLPIAIFIIWTIDLALIQSLSNPFSNLVSPLKYFEHSFSFFLGAGGIWGPSILHGLTLVLFGMIMAEAVRGGSITSKLALVVLVFMSLVLTAREIGVLGFRSYMLNIADISVYRANNHYLYYLYGIIYAVIAVGISWMLHRVSPLLIGKTLNYIGSRTFEFFLIINILIVSIPGSITAANMLVSTAVFIGFTVASCLLIRIWETKVKSLSLVVALIYGMRKTSNRLALLLVREEPSASNPLIINQLRK